jgi:hypothetical protein
LVPEAVTATQSREGKACSRLVTQAGAAWAYKNSGEHIKTKRPHAIPKVLKRNNLVFINFSLKG